MFNKYMMEKIDLSIFNLITSSRTRSLLPGASSGKDIKYGTITASRSVIIFWIRLSEDEEVVETRRSPMYRSPTVAHESDKNIE
jgi:hypothetical protein